MKFLLKLIALCLCYYYIQKFCTGETAGFTVETIQSNIAFHPDWVIENDPLNPRIFDQKFHYLASGGQAYAFASEDGHYVLKFFKHHYRHPNLWHKALFLVGPLGDKKRAQIERHSQKLHRDFKSYVLAKQLLSEEAGLLYVHLNKTTRVLPKAHIVDKLNIRHIISLDKVEFILQRRAVPLHSHLQSLIEKKEMEKAKKSIDSVIDLIIARCEKGIHDEDAKIHRNLGFLDDKAMIIDVGRLKQNESKKERAVQKQDLEYITGRLHSFLMEKSPPLATYLEMRIHEL